MPPAPISAAITTIPNAIMMVWLTPRMMTRLAIGSCTLRRSCQRVEPSDSAASTVVGDTSRMPSAVIRIAGGIDPRLNGSWSWDHRTDITTWADDPVTHATQEATMADDAPIASEGWLKLNPAEEAK